MRTTSPLHAVTWFLWAAAAATCVQMAPSPVYVALVVAIAFLIVSAHRIDGALSRAFPVLVTLGVVFGLVRVGLTALTTHDPSAVGTSDVWFTLPVATLPRILGGFTVGGTIEWTVVLFAAAQAFAVVGIMAAFGAFNAVASHHELIQATPRAFHEPGLIVTVALAFIPSTIAAARATREADRARTGGRVVKRGRTVRLTVPILESGLERAMSLAESMDSRGYARLGTGRGDRAAAWLGFASMAALGGAFVALVGRAPRWSVVAGAAGLVGLVAAVVISSRGSRNTRYRPRRLTRLDAAVMVLVLAAPVGLAAVRAAGEPSLTWIPIPVSAPTFALLPALCIALLAVPALVPPLPVRLPDPTATPSRPTEAVSRPTEATVPT